MPFSDEPTGVAFNPNNQHLFFSDDDADEVFEIDPGPDGNYFTGDDIRTSFDTRSINNIDAEDIAYGNGNLYIADGTNSEVYEIRPGPNGRFDGQSPAGDDQAYHFDTSSLDIPDPEAVEFNSNTGTLYITGRGSKKVIETTTSGSLLSVIDIAFLNAKNPSGLAYAPGSFNPAEMNLYIVARGIDNDSNSNENDGKMYEIFLGYPPPPLPSISINDVTVTEGNAGTVNADFTVTLSASSSQTVTVNYATFNGTATAGSDYVANSNTLSFPSGTTTQTISVVVNGDAFGEPDETFFVNLSNPTNATLADNQGQGTIVNDDAPPTTLVFNPT
ncbi:MAG: Calx-beta domain-containing protein, partial [bacterium]